MASVREHYENVLAQHYSRMFGDVPSAFTWLGAAIIIASGLFIALKEARR